MLVSEMESRTQRSRPRPRLQKNPSPRPRTNFSRTDLLQAKGSNAQDQGHNLASGLKKKKGHCAGTAYFFQNFRRSQKKVIELEAEVCNIKVFLGYFPFSRIKK